MTTQALVVPGNIPLPARLQTPGAAAEIAAANAAAAGGIKVGGFPSISIKAGKFHEKEAGELKTYMQPALPGQPALPLQCLEAVIVAANPALTKTYYPGDYVEGSQEEPACRSSNGITPDADVVAKQHDVCATCPQNQWGSKISKLSGKEIKACDDQKQLAILPAADLSYKALGLTIGKGSISNWGKFVRALSGRSIPVAEIVVNITFDATATGVLQFAFNRYLTDEESIKARQRANGDDVKVIVAQSRVAPVPQLTAPTPSGNPVKILDAATPVLGSRPLDARSIVMKTQLDAMSIAAATPQGSQLPPAPTGFGATAPVFNSTTSVTRVTTTAESPKRRRRTRAQIEADNAAKQQDTQAALVFSPPVDLSYLPEPIKQAVLVVGADSVAGQALLVQFPRPINVQPTATQASVPAAAEYTKPAPAVASTVGFGASPVPVDQLAPAVSTAASSLKDRLQKLLNANQSKVG